MARLAGRGFSRASTFFPTRWIDAAGRTLSAAEFLEIQRGLGPSATPAERAIVELLREDEQRRVARESWARRAGAEDEFRRFGGFGEEEPQAVTLLEIPLGADARELRADSGRRGPRFHGFEIGQGHDDDTEARDPFLSEGLETVLDWDFRLRLREDNLGFKARYRDPGPLEAVTLGFKRYMDVPDAVGLGGARDALFESFGRSSSERSDGFEIDVSAVLTPYWGVGAGYGAREQTDLLDAQSYSMRRHSDLSVGFTPLGRNEGRDWNFSLVGSVNHQEIERRGGETPFEGEGFGYSAGVAFHHAIDQLPVPWINPDGGRDRWGLSWDRLRAGLLVSDSEVERLTLRASVGASIYLTRYLRASVEFAYSFFPEDRDSEFDTSTGLNFRLGS